jgi:hypothetical protein
MVERQQLTSDFDLLVIKTLLEQLQASILINADTGKKFCINLSAASVLDEAIEVKRS